MKRDEGTGRKGEENCAQALALAAPHLGAWKTWPGLVKTWPHRLTDSQTWLTDSLKLTGALGSRQQQGQALVWHLLLLFARTRARASLPLFPAAAGRLQSFQTQQAPRARALSLTRRARARRHCGVRHASATAAQAKGGLVAQALALSHLAHRLAHLAQDKIK